MKLGGVRQRRSWSGRGPRVALIATVACALGIWLLVGATSGSRARPQAWRDITREVGPAEFGRPEQDRFVKASDFANFLRHVETGATARIPRIDFARDEAVLFAVGPRSSTGYSLVVRGVREQDGRIVVTVAEQTPRLGSRARAALTYPFVLITLPRSADPVGVEWLQRP